MRKANKLQILTENGWKYVFCWNISTCLIVTTETEKKALPGTDIDFFKSKSDAEFRIV